MNFTLQKTTYDSLAGWKWRALKHVMGDLLLGTPGGLDDENPILDPDGNRVVVFSDSRFDGEKAAALRIILEAVDNYDDEITDDPETVLAPVSAKAGMASAWVQPTGAHDAYAQGAVVFHGGRLWRSTTADNVWEPGVSGWHAHGVPSEGGGDPAPGEFVQPTGAHDTYNTGDLVTFEGAVYRSLVDNNAYSPTAYAPNWELVE